MMSDLAVWAWRTSNTVNFGDELGPAILDRLGYTVRRVDDVADADLIACGSILEHAAEHGRPGLIVWGSGMMNYNMPDISRLDVRAVRGHLTARALGLDVPVQDPGILVPELWRRPPVRFRLGIVRHYVDGNPYPPSLDADAEISCAEPVNKVINFIGSCARIASSSLHGLVVADAWDIPCLRLHHPDVGGGDFKWLDWLSGDSEPNDLLNVLP